MSDVFVGRQPIYDAKLNVVAYELLFRKGADQTAAVFTDGDTATCTVLSNTLLEIGLQNMCGSRPAYINFTRGFLEGRYPIPADPQQIVIEVLESEQVDEPLLAALSDLRQLGFKIALDDYLLTPATRPLLEVADIVKLDVMTLSPDQARRTVREIRTFFKVHLLAEKVETAEQFETCREAGFDLFQGYFLSRPKLIQGHQVPKNRLALLQLLARIQNPDIEIRELERLVCQDLVLTTRLLQLVNSSSLAVVRKVDSVQRALVLLGIARVRNLATLSLLASMDDAPPPLLEIALTRAKLCELLGAHLKGAPEAYFTVGLLSSLDLFLQRPLEEVMATMPLSEDVMNALLHREGGMGAALRCALSLEQEALSPVSCLTLSPTAVWEAYVEALKHVEGPNGLLQQGRAA